VTKSNKTPAEAAAAAGTAAATINSAAESRVQTN